MTVVTFSKVEKFHDKDVRTYEYDDGSGNIARCMTIPDLARMAGYPANDVWNLVVGRRKDEFKNNGYLITVSRLIQDKFGRGRKPQMMLSESGVLRALMLLEELRIKDPEKRAKIQEVQRWAIQVLGSFQRGEHLKAEVAPGNKTTVGDVVEKAIKDQHSLPSSEVKDPIDVARENLRRINDYMKEQVELYDVMTRMGAQPVAVASSILWSAEKDTGYDFTQFRVSLPRAPGDIPVYTASDLCRLHFINYSDLIKILIDEEIIEIPSPKRKCKHNYEHSDILLRERGYDLGCEERQYLSRKNKTCTCKTRFVLFSGNVRKLLYSVCGSEGERKFFDTMRAKSEA